jgi:hypothetical protein
MVIAAPVSTISLTTRTSSARRTAARTTAKFRTKVRE